MDDKELKKKLTPEAYKVLRQKGTEAPFSGKFLYNEDKGVYACAVCGNKLFSSDAKYESTTPGLIGWPSFQDVLDEKSIKLLADKSLGMERTEVVCSKCNSHLGHLFDDDSSPNGKHFCINSICLDFEATDQQK